MIVLKMLLTITSFPLLPLLPSPFPPPLPSFLLRLKLQTMRGEMIVGKREKLVNQVLTTEYWEWIWTK